MGRIIVLLIFCISMIGCNFKSKNFELTATEDVLIFQDHESAAFLQGRERTLKAISILKKGDKCKVISSHQGKDYLAYKIQFGGKKEGYVIHGDNFVVNKID